MYQVELTGSFLERLESIAVFLTEADAAFAFDALVDELRSTVIPNLARFPRIGRRYLDTPPQTTEALAQLAALPAGAPDSLRVYLHGDYLLLYAAVEANRGSAGIHVKNRRNKLKSLSPLDFLTPS